MDEGIEVDFGIGAQEKDPNRVPVRSEDGRGYIEMDLFAGRAEEEIAENRAAVLDCLTRQAQHLQLERIRTGLARDEQFAFG